MSTRQQKNNIREDVPSETVNINEKCNKLTFPNVSKLSLKNGRTLFDFKYISVPNYTVKR